MNLSHIQSSCIASLLFSYQKGDFPLFPPQVTTFRSVDRSGVTPWDIRAHRWRHHRPFLRNFLLKNGFAQLQNFFFPVGGKAAPNSPVFLLWTIPYSKLDGSISHIPSRKPHRMPSPSFTVKTFYFELKDEITPQERYFLPKLSTCASIPPPYQWTLPHSKVGGSSTAVLGQEAHRCNFVF